MTAPMSGCASRSVGPDFDPPRGFDERGQNGFSAAPPTTAVEPAMQRSPAQPKAASITPRVEFSTSASGMMMT
jgi:hypothetical protein